MSARSRISPNISKSRPNTLARKRSASGSYTCATRRNSSSLLNIQAVCALRFFFRNTLNRKIDIDRIPLPRYETKLPVILSKEEVKALLEAPRRLDQRAILATLYGAGLRVSEVTNLKVSDLDRQRKVIWVRGGKGRKDRQVMLAEPLRSLLAAYWRWRRPTNWLFPGRNSDYPIGTNGVFRACVAAARKAGINKTI